MSSARKVTPVRLAPELRQGLEMLQSVLKKPVNKLINEAVEGYLERRTAEAASDLEAVLDRIKAYRSTAPKFEADILRFAAAEAESGADDPAQGTTFVVAAAEVGPAQTMVRSLLRG